MPMQLRRRQPEQAAAVVAPQDLEQEPRDRVEREERGEDLPVVALARMHPQQAERGDRERRGRLVDLRRVHGQAPQLRARRAGAP